MPFICDCTIKFRLQISDIWQNVCYCDWVKLMIHGIGPGDDEQAFETILREIEVCKNIFTKWYIIFENTGLDLHLNC